MARRLVEGTVHYIYDVPGKTRPDGCLHSLTCGRYDYDAPPVACRVVDESTSPATWYRAMSHAERGRVAPSVIVISDLVRLETGA
jgi:hypothetical protein